MMMTILLWLLAIEVVVMTTSGAASDDKVGIIIIHRFQCRDQSSLKSHTKYNLFATKKKRKKKMSPKKSHKDYNPGLILGLRPANARRRY